MDRPPAHSAVTVNLFGRPFFSSLSAPSWPRFRLRIVAVYFAATATGYTAHILPEIPYDRRALGQRQGRVELTQQIMSAFEPALHLYSTNGTTSFRSGPGRKDDQPLPPAVIGQKRSGLSPPAKRFYPRGVMRGPCLAFAIVGLSFAHSRR